MTTTHSILDTLNKAQKEAVTYTGKHLLVLAGPGTGKTRVITHRIAHLICEVGIDPESILAITFTNRAAGEMKNRVINLLSGTTSAKPWMGTFHGFSHWLLRRYWKDANLPKDFVIYDRDDQKSLIREILNKLDLPTSRAGVYLDVIQKLKDDFMDAKSYAIHAQVSTDPYRASIGQVYLAYQEGLRAKAAVDFGDLLLEATTLLRDNPPICAALQREFGYVFVDEYQDVNYAQYILIKHLMGEATNLTVVSDVDQSIYVWRNAQPRYTLEFDKDFKDTRTIVLSENYRSTPEIIAAAVRLIEKNEQRKPKDLVTTRSSGAPPTTLVNEDDKEEAKNISQKIKGLLENKTEPRDIAIFYRTNAQSRNFEIELKNSAIPYRLVGALGFYARREIKDTLAFARILANPKDEVSLWRVLTNFSSFSLTPETLKKVKKYMEEKAVDSWQAIDFASKTNELVSRRAAQKLARLLEVYASLSQKLSPPASLDSILEAIAQESGYLEELEQERALNIWELVESCRDYQKEHPETTLLEFLNHTSLLASVSADNYNNKTNTNTVSLMTIHLAKGLEFKAVFLTGLEEGLFPFKASKTNPDELEEERRIFYVGMTRAKDLLYLSWAKRRMLFGNYEDNNPSRFLYEAGLLEGEWSNKPKLKRGARVKHPLFGEGRVLTISGQDEDAKITISFVSGATRKFLMKIAPLEIV